MQKTLPNGKWRKRLKIKALPPFAELHKVRAGNCKIFLGDTETFSNIWTEYSEDYEDFHAAYEDDMRRYGTNPGMEGKPGTPENTFPVSMIPWTTFEGFNLNLQKGYRYLIPIFTMGKYYEENNRIMLPLAIQVHHAVCDGFHVCRFINELQDLINA